MPQRVDNTCNEDTTSGESGEEDAMQEDHEDQKCTGRKRAATTRVRKKSEALVKEAKDKMQADVDTKCKDHQNRMTLLDSNIMHTSKSLETLSMQFQAFKRTFPSTWTPYLMQSLRPCLQRSMVLTSGEPKDVAGQSKLSMRSRHR